MSVVELKKRIIDKIGAIEDETILSEIYNFLQMESELESIYKLTEPEKKAVEEGLKDIQSEKVFSSERASALIKEWLKK